MNFTLTSASWFNMVERFLRDLCEQRLRRGIGRPTQPTSWRRSSELVRCWMIDNLPAADHWAG
jgi:hypothetical protein